MKKILLSLLLITSFTIVKAQTVLNEIYTEPGAGKSEFFELYNSGTGAQNVDCFTLLIYWRNSTFDRGWWVVDLPNQVIASKGFFAGASASPFNVQNQTGVVANLNWNDINFRNGSTGGYLKKYQLNSTNTGYNDVSPANTTSISDLFTDVSIIGGHNYIQIVYVNGVFSNAFWGGGSSNIFPIEITGMASLPIDMSGSCTDFSASFGSIITEYVNESPGSDNGYAREFDGKCGVWDKTSNSLSHTPGAPNGGAASATGDLTIAAVITCPDQILEPSTITYNINGVTGEATEANSFPITVDCYIDNGTTPGELDGSDMYIGTQVDAAISDPAKSFNYLPQDVDPILVFRTSQGCFDKVLIVGSACATLPIKLQSFTAVRERSNVILNWTTALEENNRGFYIQRLIGNGSWENLGYVTSQAINGNSSSPLHYEYADFNNNRGITQYRLKQMDIDGQFSYSLIRSVRGEGQKSNTIIYPNPTKDGKVTVVFEDDNISRNVSVVSMDGRIVKQWKNITGNTLQIENLVTGFYTVRIINNQTSEQVVEKIVVQSR